MCPIKFTEKQQTSVTAPGFRKDPTNDFHRALDDV
jgi:hypothetical protein